MNGVVYLGESGCICTTASGDVVFITHFDMTDSPWINSTILGTKSTICSTCVA